MSPGEAKKKLKTTRQKKCPECGSEKVIYTGRVGSGTFGGKLPDPTRRLFQCQDCGKGFRYEGPSI